MPLRKSPDLLVTNGYIMNSFNPLNTRNQTDPPYCNSGAFLNPKHLLNESEEAHTKFSSFCSTFANSAENLLIDSEAFGITTGDDQKDRNKNSKEEKQINKDKTRQGN